MSKKKMIVTVGLPASGKSTWAKNYINENHDFVIVCKDDLRSMLFDDRYGKGTEKYVLAARDKMIKLAFDHGRSVIVADTNFNPIHIEALQNICKFHDADFEIKSFVDVPLEECIKRDLVRQKSVGKDVIMGMYDQYLRPKPAKVEYISGAPSCIIVDVDGTLANMSPERKPYDWHKVHLDTPNLAVIETVKLWSQKKVTIFVMSGRDSICRRETCEWLDKWNIPFHKLLMRKEGDNRKDSIVKRELYDYHIAGKYNVELVMDDRDQVVSLWRNDLGLTTFQVNYGNF